MFFPKKLFLSFFLLVSVGAFAQNVHYYVLFSARFPTLRPLSIGGHAFVTWRREDSTLTIEEQYTYGFYPKKYMGIFRDVEGQLIEGYVKNSNRELFLRRFIVETDSLTYYQTLENAKNWNKENYSLFDKNCVHFLDEIAVQLGLTPPPPRSIIIPRKPQRYIKLLKKLNRSRIVQNEHLENVRIRILKKVQLKDEEEINVED